MPATMDCNLSSPHKHHQSLANQSSLNSQSNPFSFPEKPQLQNSEELILSDWEKQHQNNNSANIPNSLEDDSSNQNLISLKPEPQDILFIHSNYKDQNIQFFKIQNRCLGLGGFGSIYEGRLRTNAVTWQKVAIKEYLHTNEESKKKFRLNYEGELESLILLDDCPQTIKLKAAFYLNIANSPKLFLVLEFCPLGSLENHMKTIENRRIFILQILEQLVRFMHFAHNIPSKKQLQAQISKQKGEKKHPFANNLKKICPCQTVIHKDIKPANILVRHIDKENIIIAICDFGTSSIVPTHDLRVDSYFSGTRRFQSPEMKLHKVYDSRTDCWSAAMTILDLFYKPIKYQGLSLPKYLQSAKQLSSETVSRLQRQLPNQKKVREVMRRCLEYNSENRAFSCELREIWGDTEKIVRDLEMEKKMFNIVTRLIQIVIALEEEIPQQSTRMTRQLLTTLCDFCCRSIVRALERNPYLKEQLEMNAIQQITRKILGEYYNQCATRIDNEQYLLKEEEKERKVVKNNCEALLRNKMLGKKIQGQLNLLSETIDFYMK